MKKIFLLSNFGKKIANIYNNISPSKKRLALLTIVGGITISKLLAGGYDKEVDERMRQHDLTSSKIQEKRAKGKYYPYLYGGQKDHVLYQSDDLPGGVQVSVAQPKGQEQQAKDLRDIYVTWINKLYKDQQNGTKFKQPLEQALRETAEEGGGDKVIEYVDYYNEFAKKEKNVTDSLAQILSNLYDTGGSSSVKLYNQTKDGDWEEINYYANSEDETFIKGTGKIKVEGYDIGGRLVKTDIIEPRKESALEKSIKQVGDKYVGKYPIAKTKNKKEIYLIYEGYSKKGVLEDMKRIEEKLNQLTDNFIRMAAKEDGDISTLTEKEFNKMFK